MGRNPCCDSDTNPRASGHPGQACAALRILRHRRRLADHSCQLGVGNEACELRRYRNQKGFFVLREPPVIALLYHQNTQEIALMHNGCAKKCIEGFLAQPLNQLKLGVRTGIVQIQRFFAGGNPTHQAFIETQTELTDLFRVQPLGRAKDQFLRGFVVQVNRANIGVHRRPDLGDDQPECVLKGVRSVHVLN